jgi:membrane fusion protein, heavy metal efflux system
MASQVERAPLFGSSPRTHEPRRARAGLLALALAVVAAVVFLVHSARSRHDAAAPSPPSDVPQRVGDGIELSEEARARAGIEATPATRGPLMPLLHVVGTIEFDPTRVAAVGTRAPGIVTNVLHVEGDEVERGDLLAVIESPAVTEAQTDERVALAKKRAALANETRERNLLERGLTTAREHEQAVSTLEEQRALASAARERVDTLGGGSRSGVSELRAPVAGVVAQRTIAPGQNVGASTIAFRVGDLGRLWIQLRVFERHVGLIREGDAVDVEMVADGRHPFHGRVAHVGSVLDPSTRTTNVRLEVENESLSLRPGQAVEATIHASGPARVALSVPSSAVTYVDGKPTVFVAESPTRFVVRNVELGLDGGDRVEIVSGVHDGEKVVSKSVLALKSELFR